MKFFGKGLHNKTNSLRHCTSQMICCLAIVLRNIFAAVISTRWSEVHAFDSESSTLGDARLEGEIHLTESHAHHAHHYRKCNSSLEIQRTEKRRRRVVRYLCESSYSLITLTGVRECRSSALLRTLHFLISGFQFQIPLIPFTPHLFLYRCLL